MASFKLNTENKTTKFSSRLLTFSDQEVDSWNYTDAYRGVQIFGGIGSGKSSGSGKTLALSYLKNGFGGIVLTGKVDETEAWLEYAKQTDRLTDIIVFGEHNSKYVKNYPSLKRLNDRILEYLKRYL